MNKKRKFVTILLIVAVTAGLMLTAHLLVNYFDIIEVAKKLHGG